METATVNLPPTEARILFAMAKDRPATRETVADNVKALLRLREWSQAELGRQAGLPTRTVNAVVNKEGACTVETAEKIANAFGLSGWHLLIPNLPDELLDTPTLSRLVEAYARVNGESRDLINDLTRKLSIR